MSDEEQEYTWEDAFHTKDAIPAQTEEREVAISPPLEANAAQLQMIDTFSREVVDLLHDKGFLSPSLPRAAERWLEEQGVPDLLIRFIAEFDKLEGEK